MKSRDLIGWIRSYGERRINSLLIDTRRCIPPYIVLDFGNVGLLGLQAPKSCGGLELSNRATVAVLEQLAAVDLSLATFVVVHNSLGIRPIMNAAQEPARSKMLASLATGRVLGAFALTEPAAGSNPNGIEGTAVLGADGQVRLNATKMWIGSAGWAGFISVFARYVDASGKPRGTCGYVVPADAPGLVIGPELLTMGMRGMVQNMVRFEDVVLTDAYRLGGLGEGLAVAQDAMMRTRLALGALFLGAMKRCLQLATRYAERRTGICADRLIANPLTRQRLSTLIAQTEVLERLIVYTSEGLDRNEQVPEELLVVTKACGSEFLWQATDWAIQMLGGRGYLESNVVTQIMRDARVGRIFEGPTETLLHHMGARLMLNERPLTEFLSQKLDASDISHRLVAVRDAVKTRCTELSAQYPGRQARDHGNAILGDIAAKGILLAVARNAATGACPDFATRWAETVFEQALAEALGGDSVSPVLSANAISEIVNGYQVGIGNVEQSLPGEHWQLDPYLQAGPGSNASPW